MTWIIRSLIKQSALLALVTLSLHANAAELSILSAGATRPALSAIIESYQKHSGNKLNAEYLPVGVIMKALADGATPDVIIITADVIDDAEHKGWTVPGSAIPVGSVGVGVAVREQAKSPDISSPEALKQTLLSAKSITYMNPEKGTSGKHFSEVLKRLGIAEQMKPKTILGESGFIVEPVARGEIEIGIQQITEILPVKGVKLVGPLPASLQKTTIYIAALGAHSHATAAARDFILTLRGVEAKETFKQKGFTVP